MILTQARLRWRHRFPVVTLALLVSCLMTTVPQFFSGMYSRLAGAAFQYNLPWAFTLSAFSHSPDILAPHLVGNLLVLLTMGTLIELALGSNTLALASLLGFGVTRLVDLCRGFGESHGASGIFWGYHLVVFFLLVLYSERYGLRRLLSEPYFWFFCALICFDLVGINLLEVLVLHQRFFANFGQTLHLVSLVAVTPYLLIARRRMEADAATFWEPGPLGKNRFGVATAVLGGLLLINAVATVLVLTMV